MSRSGPAYAHALPSTTAQAKTAVAGPGLALTPEIRGPFEQALQADFSGVRVHTGAAAAAANARAGARAFAFGSDLAFGQGEFQPQTPRGQVLLGHELVHVAQAQRGTNGVRSAAETEAERLAPALNAHAPVAVQNAAPQGPAFALNDYFNTSPDTQNMPLTLVLQDMDEIAEYLDRQFEMTEENANLYLALEALENRKAQLLRGVLADRPAPSRRRRKRRRRRGRAETEAPLPEAAPRVLREMRSMQLDDPAEVSLEVDRIVAWLQRNDVTTEDRDTLRMELETLAPMQHQALQEQAAQRQSDRVQIAFQSADGSERDALDHQLRIVQSIFTDPAEPEARFLLHEGERVRISIAQAEGLRADTTRALQKTMRDTRAQATRAMDDYEFQQNLNEDQYIVSGIAGWLGGVDDPWLAVTIAMSQVDSGLEEAQRQLDRGALTTMVVPLMIAAEAAIKLKRAIEAWRGGLIEGASLAVGVLTFIRDASAAIVTAIAAVVAAPLVAGYVGALGAGTLVSGALTTAGTGAVVGSGSAVLWGGTEYVGQRAAGASHADAAEAAYEEGKRRGAEGAAAGVGGGGARVLGQALRVGGSGSFQLARRGAAEFGGNFGGSFTGEVLQGRDVGDAANQSLRTSAVGALGVGLGGLGRSPAARELIEMGASAGLSSADTLAQGGDFRDVALNLTVLGATHASTSRNAGLQRQLAGYESTGRTAGQRHRRQATSAIGAAGLGLQLSLPPSGFGGTRPNRPIPQTTLAADQPAQTSQHPTLDTPVATRRQESGLELDRRPWQERGTADARDPATIDLDSGSGLPLELDTSSRRRSRQPARNQDFGLETGIVTGTEHRTGMHFNELNSAEIGQTRLRIRRGESGRTETVRFTLTAEAVASTQSTRRSFTWDPSTGGPQAISSDYTGTGYDRGHLAPREAASLDQRFVQPEFHDSHAEIQAQTERAMDQMTNVVPMDREFNQHGRWRQAERQANHWASQHGQIDIEIHVVYGDSPARLPNGLEIPAGFIRVERAPNGRILRRRYFPNG
jgi:Domain of unknown function (DUF4157)/DNA/RNA non-specific endonuclease